MIEILSAALTVKRSLTELCLRAGIFATVLLGAITWAQAKPDFTASEITVASPTVQEGDVARFKLWLRNRGDQAADPVQVQIRQPLTGHVVEVSGLADAKADNDAREVTGAVPLPMGGERVVEVAVLAPRDSGGRMLSMTVKMIHYQTMAENWLHASVQIDTRPRSDGVRIGRLVIAPAGSVTLGWLLATGLAIGLAATMARGRPAGGFFGPIPGVVAIMLAIGFWLIFAAMAWRDYCVLRKWEETTGIIVGRRIETQTSSGRESSGSTSLSHHARTKARVCRTVSGRGPRDSIDRL